MSKITASKTPDELSQVQAEAHPLLTFPPAAAAVWADQNLTSLPAIREAVKALAQSLQAK